MIQLTWGRTASAEELWQLWRRADGDAVVPLFDSFRGYLDDPAIDAERNLLVAREDGELRGFLLCADELTFKRPEFYVFSMASTGPIEAMLCEAEKRAAHLPFIGVGIDRRAPAVSVLERLGYKYHSSTFEMSRPLRDTVVVPFRDDVQVQPLMADDIDDWIRIENASLRGLRGFAEVTRDEALHFLSNTDQPGHVLFAMDRGTKVGIAFVRFLRDERGASVAEINTLGVLPEARDRGIGSVLLGHTLNWLCERGATAAKLTVVAENEGAIRLYERFGFERTREKVTLEKRWA